MGRRGGKERMGRGERKRTQEIGWQGRPRERNGEHCEGSKKAKRGGKRENGPHAYIYLHTEHGLVKFN